MTQLILPYHSSLAEACPVDDQKKKKVECKICKKKVDMIKMRQHIGAHFVKGEVQNMCGFCGLTSCDINIACGSGRGKTASEIPTSTCEYYEKFSIKSAAKVSKTSPCTNRPVGCPLCKPKRTLWSYNMYKHYEDNHSDYPRQNWIITDEEKGLLQKL